jgi:O-antigen/teichoic acid export membrane protein
MLPILVTSVVSIVSVPLYFKALGEQMYAMWFYMGTLTGAFGFMDLGLGVAIGRFIGVALGSNNTIAAKEYWASGNALAAPALVILAALFLFLGMVFGPSWFKLGGSDAAVLRWSVLWGALGLFFTYYGAIWQNLCCTYLDFKFYSIVKTWSSLVSSVGCVLVALYFKNIAHVFFFNMLLSIILFWIFFKRVNNKFIPLDFSFFKKSRLVEMSPYTIKTFLQLISGSVLGSMDRLFLGRYAPAADFAAFGVAQNIGGRISGLSVAIMGPIFHNTTRGVGGDQSKAPADIYQQSFSLVFPFCSLAAMGVFFWSQPAIELWLGDINSAAVITVFPWIFLGLTLNAIANISGAQIGGINRVGTGLIFQTSVSLLSAACVVGGFFAMGIEGAAIGFFASRLVWLGQDVFVRRQVRVPLADYSKAGWVLIRQFLSMLALWLPFYLFAKENWVWLLGAVFSALTLGLLEIYLQIKSFRKIS